MEICAEIMTTRESPCTIRARDEALIDHKIACRRRDPGVCALTRERVLRAPPPFHPPSLVTISKQLLPTPTILARTPKTSQQLSVDLIHCLLSSLALCLLFPCTKVASKAPCQQINKQQNNGPVNAHRRGKGRHPRQP